MDFYFHHGLIHIDMYSYGGRDKLRFHNNDDEHVGTFTSFCSRCASCSVSNVTKPYPLLTPALSTIIFVDLTFPYAEKTRHSSASVVSPLISNTFEENTYNFYVYNVN